MKTYHFDNTEYVFLDDFYSYGNNGNKNPISTALGDGKIQRVKASAMRPVTNGINGQKSFITKSDAINFVKQKGDRYFKDEIYSALGITKKRKREESPAQVVPPCTDPTKCIRFAELVPRKPKTPKALRPQIYRALQRRQHDRNNVCFNREEVIKFAEDHDTYLDPAQFDSPPEPLPESEWNLMEVNLAYLDTDEAYVAGEVKQNADGTFDVKTSNGPINVPAEAVRAPRGGSDWSKVRDPIWLEVHAALPSDTGLTDVWRPGMIVANDPVKREFTVLLLNRRDIKGNAAQPVFSYDKVRTKKE